MAVDVAQWLSGLGLEQYAAVFAANDIDGAILAELTSDDLIALGVVSVGHRRRLLSAITALAVGNGKTETKPPEAEPSSVPLAAPPRSDGERRQLTLMFCDLVGSTPLATRFDPEDLREVIGAYHRCVAGTVGRFGGFVAKYMGDGILVYFGYPQAHEDDAERAVRSGLAVLDAVGRVAGPEPLQVRVGIASGLVVVGDLTGDGAAQERGVVGETPNLAARLQGLAPPGSLIVADATRRQLGGLFDLQDLGPQHLAGFAEPQRAWCVLGESGAVSRFEALRSTATPLVGRDEELDLLRRRWQQAKVGEGRAVLISGEPGIGKSRLTAAISEAIADEPHTRLRYFCSPHHQDSALYPFIMQIERAAGFVRDDSAEERLAKLRALLSQGTHAEEIELLAELLSLPNTVADLNLSPQRKRAMLFEALLAQFVALARLRPILMAFEDAHWIDPTSRELLDMTIDRLRQLPVLLVITFRPEFQPPWAGQPHVTSLGLSRLGAREVAALVMGLAGNAALGSEVVEEITERTDGVPLFIEELTKAVLERAEQEDRVAAVLSASPVAALAVPATLHASLIARLDRIGAAAREVAQIGAVLGREFAYELIEPVARHPDLDTALGRLTEAGLLFCRGTPPQASYMFKHALVQDAAYGTLLRARRQELHTQVATVLEQDFVDLVERQPELLAHHLAAAGQTQRAVDQWLKAGRLAAARLAHVEAIGHLERGLALLGSLAETPSRDASEIELQLALGVSYITVKGMSTVDVRDAYARAEELAVKRGDRRQQFQALYGRWQHLGGAGSISAARPLSERLLRLTDGDADDGHRLQAHHSAWTSGWLGGEPASAHAHCQEGRRIYDPERHREHRYIYGGHDPGVCARMTAGQTEWVLGYPDKALASMRESVMLAEQIAHPFTREVAIEYAAAMYIHRGEAELALAQLAANEALRAELSVTSALPPLILKGAVQIAQGAFADAIAGIRQSLAPGGATIWRPYALCLLAEALMQQGNYAEAHAVLSDGFERIAATGERVWEAELHRIAGLLDAAQNRSGQAQILLEQALQVARQQKARSLELRAAGNLARLWAEQGRRTEAYELLAPVYGWFTEGFDTADLREAKALLDTIS